MSDIPITEKLFLNAGGWQAMKPARELLKNGRVSEAKYEPPLLSGYVREGAKNYRSGLRIKSAIDVENLCSCWESRSAGKICAHSVAVGLGYLNPPAAVVAAPNEPTMPEAPAGPRFVAADSASAALTTLHVILPPNFAGAWQKGQIMIVVEAEASRNRTLISALPKKNTFAVDGADLVLIEGLRPVPAIFENGMAILSRDAEFKKQFGPRGVIKSTSDGKIQDTGPLTIERMKTIDDEVTAGALDFLERAKQADKPFFLWWNSTRMHIWTHLKPGSQGKTGLGVYPDGMVEHDAQVGQILDKLKELGLEENTIVMYSTDNGAECFSWPDGGSTPFRNEKNSNWEGGYRVPCLIRWPGVIKPGSIYNDVFSHEDMLPTLLAAAGEPDIKEKLLAGLSAQGRDYKVHLDGYNLLPYLSGEVQEAPRKEFFYWTDGGDLCGLRYGRWKIVFQEQRAHGLDVWQDPLVTLRFPKLFCLRTDPFERADHEAADYDHWRVDHAFVLVPAQGYVARHLDTFKDFPPRQKPGSFSLDQVLEALQSAPKN